ncbi:MAG: hypothetical protein ACHQRJ_22710 [Alphaproteobacteria bacterium]
MRPFWQAMAGGLLGKVLAAILIAACATVGFGPDRWVAVMIGHSSVWIAVARFSFLGLAVVVLTLLFLPAVKTLWPRQIPLGDAVRIAHEQTEDIFWGGNFGGLIPTVEERLVWLSYSFLARREGKLKVRLSGRRPPSTVMRLISEKDLGLLKWKPGTNVLVSEMPPCPAVFLDVSVNGRDLRRHLKLMRKIEIDAVGAQ